MPGAVGQAISAVGSLLSGGGGTGVPGAVGSIDPNSPGGAYPTPLSGPTGPVSTTPMMGSTGTTGGGFNLKDLAGLAAVVGKTIEGIRNYQLQQNLQDPTYVAKQMAKLERQQIPALVAAEGPGIANQYGAAGLSGAPGLISEGIAQAVTPQVIGDAGSNYFSGIQGSENIMGDSGKGLADVSALIQDLYGG